MRSILAAKLDLYKNLVSLTTQFRSRHIQPKHLLKMNEAFLRYEKGNDIFDISFRYVDEVMKVDRQFNFSRQASETVNNFLKRVDTSVCKIVNKKVRRTISKLLRNN